MILLSPFLWVISRSYRKLILGVIGFKLAGFLILVCTVSVLTGWWDWMPEVIIIGLVIGVLRRYT